MTDWEYQVIDLYQKLFDNTRKFPKADDETKLLNTYGKEGWELISVTEAIFENNILHKAYFKRKI